MGLGVAARSFRNLRKDRRRAGGRRQAGEWTRSKQHSPSRDDPKRCHQLWGLRATSPFCQHEFAEAAIQHRSTAVRTAYHVPMMYQGAIVATMDWLYPLSGFVVGAIVGLTGMGGRFSDDAVADTAFRRPSAHGGGNRLALRRRNENGWHRDPLQEG